MRNFRYNQSPNDKPRHGITYMAAALAVAGAFHPTTMTGDKIPTKQAQTPASVAQAMTETIHEGLPIGYIDANKQVAWASIGSRCLVNYVTDVEISEPINNVTTYFQIEQTGHTLNSLIVEPIKAARELSIASPLVALSNLPGRHVETSVGIISLNAQNQPVTRVEMDNNQVETTTVGVTRNIGCQEAITD